MATVSLLHERSVAEIAEPAELTDVTRLVSRCSSHYPPGAYDTLKALRDEAAQRLAERITVGAGSNRPRRRHMCASAELKRPDLLRLAAGMEMRATFLFRAGRAMSPGRAM
jgi:hypothetical protein